MCLWIQLLLDSYCLKEKGYHLYLDLETYFLKNILAPIYTYRLSLDPGGELGMAVHPFYNNCLPQYHLWLRPYQEQYKIQQYTRRIK